MKTNSGSRRGLRGGARSAATAALLLGVLAGCGDTSTQALSGSDNSALHGEVAQIRAAAERGDLRAASAAVGDFRSVVHRLLGEGALTEADALALLSQADQVGDRLAQEIPAPVATVTAKPAPAKPAPRAVPARATLADALRLLQFDRFDERKDDGKRKDDDERGHGRGKHGGDDDDD